MIKNKKIQITNSSNERGDIITCHTNIERITREYYENFMPIISTTLMKQVKFLKDMLLKQTQKTENLNNLICIKEIEFVIKNIPKKTTTDSYSFPEEFYKTFKEEIKLNLHKISENIQGENIS